MIPIDYLVPIHNHLVIQFVDGQTGGEFVDKKTESGIILTSIKAEQGTTPRWAKIIKAGPECDEEIKEGEYALLEPGMWSVGFMFAENKRYWRTDATKVMLVSGDHP